MKTLDREYLATHPEGDERADLTLSHPVPDRIDVPANPDGTRPQISLRVTGENYLQVLHVLTALHDDGGEDLLATLLDDVFAEDEIPEQGELDDLTPLLKERAQEVVVPFRTFEMVATMPEGTVSIFVTAPSIVSAVEATVGMTSPGMLTNVAIGLCPTIDDEDDWAENEVLVVS